MCTVRMNPVKPHAVRDNNKALPMAFIAHNLTYIAVGAVALVLAAGLLNMFRGSSPNTSQKLMRWRVGLQFIAIIVIMAAVYFSSR